MEHFAATQRINHGTGILLSLDNEKYVVNDQMEALKLCHILGWKSEPLSDIKILRSFPITNETGKKLVDRKTQMFINHFYGKEAATEVDPILAAKTRADYIDCLSDSGRYINLWPIVQEAISNKESLAVLNDRIRLCKIFNRFVSHIEYVQICQELKTVDFKSLEEFSDEDIHAAWVEATRTHKDVILISRLEANIHGAMNKSMDHISVSDFDHHQNKICQYYGLDIATENTVYHLFHDCVDNVLSKSELVNKLDQLKFSIDWFDDVYCMSNPYPRPGKTDQYASNSDIRWSIFETLKMEMILIFTDHIAPSSLSNITDGWSNDVKSWLPYTAHISIFADQLNIEHVTDVLDEILADHRGDLTMAKVVGESAKDIIGMVGFNKEDTKHLLKVYRPYMEKYTFDMKYISHLNKPEIFEILDEFGDLFNWDVVPFKLTKELTNQFSQHLLRRFYDEKEEVQIVEKR